MRSFPDGMDVNVIKAKALFKTKLLAKTKSYKEHVTLFIKDNPKTFKIKNFIAGKNYWPELGITLDEKKDFYYLEK